MGISSLNPFLREKCPEAFKDLPYSYFRGKRVAVDSDNVLRKLMSRSHKEIVNKTDVSCGNTNDGTATVSIGNGGNVSDYKFTWTPNVSSTNSATNLALGAYTVKATKLTDTSCFSTTQFSITNTPNVVIADATIINAGCNSATGTATFNTNGDAAYTFLWNDGNTPIV